MSTTGPVERLAAPPEIAHGFLGDPSWPLPRLAVRCDAEARPGYTSKKAHEYLDEPQVLAAKVKLLAQLIRKSSKPICLAGAGLSTSSGIGDYASRAAGSASLIHKARGTTKRQSGLRARPTKAHRVLAAMSQAGFLYRFVQQNHDGLPQKAGMAQAALNEIHGSWWSPDNPVVPMSGDLRSDLFEDVLNVEENTDLCMAVGTSLVGMNVDRVVETVAKRAYRQHVKRRVPLASMTHLGSVIIGIQQTRLDATCSVRMFGFTDDVFTLLAKELGLAVPKVDSVLKLKDHIQAAVSHQNFRAVRLAEAESKSKDEAAHCSAFTGASAGAGEGEGAGAGAAIAVAAGAGAVDGGTAAATTPMKAIMAAIPGRIESDHVFMVPYDKSGHRTADGKLTKLDLRPGARLKITQGPNAKFPARVSDVQLTPEGHYRVAVRVLKSASGKPSSVGTKVYALGLWMVASALVGDAPTIPVVNV